MRLTDHKNGTPSKARKLRLVVYIYHSVLKISDLFKICTYAALGREIVVFSYKYWDLNLKEVKILDAPNVQYLA